MLGVPRYRLLLESLLKATDQDNPDFKKLSEAHEKVLEVASKINNQVRHIENQTKLMDLDWRLKGIPVLVGQMILPHRRFISEHKLILYDYFPCVFIYLD